MFDAGSKNRAFPRQRFDRPNARKIIRHRFGQIHYIVPKGKLKEGKWEKCNKMYGLRKRDFGKNTKEAVMNCRNSKEAVLRPPLYLLIILNLQTLPKLYARAPAKVSFFGTHYFFIRGVQKLAKIFLCAAS